MAMASAWRELARLLGMYPSNRVQIEAKITTDKTPTQKQIERMTDAELAKIIASANIKHVED